MALRAGGDAERVTLSDTAAAASRVLGGLVPATLYVVQVRAHGRVGASDWSEGVTLVVG